MFNLELKDALKVMVIQSDVGIDVSHERMVRFFLALTRLDNAVHLKEFSLKLDPSEFVPTFSYEFVTMDGRPWVQTLIVPGTNEPSMTFSVPQPWKLSEFTPHREVRDLCIDLIKVFQVKHIKITYF